MLLKEMFRSIFHCNDFHYFFADRLGYTFGLEKVYVQNKLRELHHKELNQNVADAFNRTADIVGYHEREVDWAIAGGVAQGLAGAGAGIAAAINTQIRNSEVRARNIKRDLEANAYRAMSRAYAKSGSIDESFLLKPEEIKGLRIRTTQETHSLFQKIRITTTFAKLDTDANPNDPLFTWKKDSVSKKTRIVKLDFFADIDNRIDGYLQINMHLENGKSLYSRAVPLPLLGVGQSSSKLILHLPNSIASLSFEPIILWELTLPKEGNASEAYCISDIVPAKQRYFFDEQWQQAWNKYQQNEIRGNKRAAAWKRNYILLLIMVFLCGTFLMTHFCLWALQ